MATYVTGSRMLPTHATQAAAASSSEMYCEPRVATSPAPTTAL